MNRTDIRLRCALTLLTMFMGLSACSNGDTQQTSSDKSVVRVAALTTSGDISGDFRPLSNSEAKVQGGCNEAFANFGIIYGEKSWRKVAVTVMTEDGMGSSQVGPIALDWALVSFTDNEYDATQFRGPAELVITAHDATAPLIAGTVKGTLPGYGGMLDGKVLPDKSIDFEFTFEIAVACGGAD